MLADSRIAPDLSAHRQPTPVPLSRVDLSGSELAYVTQAVTAGEIGPSGPFRVNFEQEWAARNGARHAIAVSSGTAALHVGLAALGIGKGDEVIVPAMTYVATGNAVLYTGATPVMVDVDPDTWCIDPDACQAAVTPRTRAIMPVHLFGQPCQMHQLAAVAESCGAALFADSAHAPLASYEGRPLGSTSVLSAHSFYLNKTLTCGEGGALLVNDDALADVAQQLRAHGLDMKTRHSFRRLGYNYRLSNLACAILCSQLERADRIMARCTSVDTLYRSLLAGVPGATPQASRSQTRRSHWLFPVLLDPCSGRSRDQMLQHLAERGVEARPFFEPLHRIAHLSSYHDARQGALPTSERLGRDGLLLPLHGTMADDEVYRVVDALVRGLEN